MGDDVGGLFFDDAAGIGRCFVVVVGVGRVASVNEFNAGVDDQDPRIEHAAGVDDVDHAGVNDTCVDGNDGTGIGGGLSRSGTAHDGNDKQLA